MSNKYNESYKKQPKTTNNVTTENLVEEVEVKNETPEENPVKETTSCIGTVTGCEYLNVRREASIDSIPPKCVIAKGDVLTINIKESTAEWYKVRTDAGDEGFCMKQYITVAE